MAKWMCSLCGYQIDNEKPLSHCPSCDKDCMFVDVTCYIPDCGGEDNVNSQVVDAMRRQNHPEE